ncbi:glycosyltransferase [Chitinophaga sp. H8]|uniref:Glycosyltransferase n=1 Tax=Chitinophaga defluvii TaxID=3163343 RepID=A0ABV2T6W0_9BACT
MKIYPMVSVIIPCFNSSMFMREAIESIMNQSYPELEILLIDDGSTDNTLDIIQELSALDGRIKLVRNERNLKLVNTLNKGISLCNGKYIARMDADDIACPLRIEKQVAYMETHPEIGLLGSFIEEFDDKRIIGRGIQPISDERIRAYIFTASAFFHPGVLIRRDVLSAHNLQYEEQFTIGQDHALWINMLQHTKAANIPEILLRYRVNAQSLTQVSNRNRSSRRVVLKAIYRSAISKAGLQLSDEELSLYSCSMAKQDVIEVVDADVSDLIKLYDKVIKYAVKNQGINRSYLKKYLAIRFIAFLFYTNAKKRPYQVVKSIFSSYFYVGIYAFIMRKYQL